MNHSAQNSVMGTESLLAQSELCEVCSGKDAEDLYIIFNALYRVVAGDVFYQGSEFIENELIMNPLSTNATHQKQKGLKTSQEKLQLFRKKLSTQGLFDLVALPRFDLLLREIFKSKYNRVQDTSCKHQELAMNFIRNFNLKNDDFLEHSDLHKRRLIENTEKLDILYNKIKQLKSEIESYHCEIDNLSERIVKKLLPNNSHFISKKMNVCDEDKDSSDDQGSDIDSSVEKKVGTTSESVNLTNSTGASSESSDKSDEEKLERKHKKSKTATFKSKLPKKATDVLKNWFLGNIQNPYPSHEAKEMLSKMTGLTRKQIQNWFTNSRKRFLEPLKKKIEGQKIGKDGSISLEQAGDIFGSDTQSQVDPNESVCPSISQEPILISHTAPQSQAKASALSFTPTIQIANEPATKASSFQNSPPQLSPQNTQPIMYPQPNNFVWVLPQPVYPYRPGFPNVLPMNTPPMIPLQHNAYSSNFSLMDASSAALQNQFPYAIQPSVMDVNTLMKQQIASNYNPINASLYNGLNHPASVGQIISNQERMSLLNKMSPYTTPIGMNSDAALYKLGAEGVQRSASGLFHPRPDLSDIGILGKKYLHKDDYLRVNLG